MQNQTHPAYIPHLAFPKIFSWILLIIAMASGLAALGFAWRENLNGNLPLISISNAVLDLLDADAGTLLGIASQAEDGRSILFKTGNGREKNGQAADSRMIPHLVLYENDTLSDEASRTISLEITGIQLPAGGGNLGVKIETQEGDPDRSSVEDYRIPVFETEIMLENDSLRARKTRRIQIDHTFSATTQAGIPTPTGYYRVEAVFTPALADGDSDQRAALEYAFLLENQWTVELEDLQAGAGGSGPSELVVYYMDMTAYQISAYRPNDRLTRAEVRPFVGDVLVPGMVKAINRQTLEWGFQWAPDWTSFRGGEDARRISVALTQTGLWFHGQAPAGGYATISINVKQTDLKTFDSLVDWILTIFSHELFHNLQRSISQEAGGSGVIDGEFEAWEFVTEGTAVVAESVYNPQLGFAHGTAEGPYFSRAKKFIAGGQNTSGSLNSSYSSISPYEAAIYWRFLYEQCGGLVDGEENSSAGMEVIFKTLEELYADEGLLNIQPEEMPASLAVLMDRVFSKLDTCPFADFRSSLAAFHRAVYGIRVKQAALSDEPQGYTGFYDPQDLLPPPDVAEVLADNGSRIYEEWIGGGYGVDFIEVQTSDRTKENGFRIEVTNTEAGSAVFTVQVWLIAGQDHEISPPSMSRLVELGEIRAGERVSAEISSSEGSEMIAAVLVSRVDGQESANLSGSYRMVVTPH
jgi:hypothetical protein